MNIYWISWKHKDQALHANPYGERVLNQVGAVTPGKIAIFVIAAGVLLLVGRSIYQDRQTEAHRKAVYAAAEKGAPWVVNASYDGGKAITWDVKGWEYNPYKNEYRIELYINWAGEITRLQYAAQGVLRIDQKQVTWEPSWHNTNLQNWIQTRHQMVGAAAGIAILGGIFEALSGNK